MNSSFRSRFTALFLIAIAVLTTSAHAAWPPDGLFLHALPADDRMTAPDGAGGIFLRFGSNLQRISPDGDKLLGPNGINVPVLTSVTGLLPDGAGGVYVTGLFVATIRIVRMDAAGNVIWSSDVCTTTGAKAGLRLGSDGQGGTLIAWSEARAPYTGTERSVYMQRVNSSGTALWTPDGIKVRSTSMATPHGGSAVTSCGAWDVCPSGDGGGFVSTSGQVNVYDDFDPVVVQFIDANGAGIVGVGNSEAYMNMMPDGSGGLYMVEDPWGYGGGDMKHFVPGAGVEWTTPLSTGSFAGGFKMAPSSDGVLVVWTEWSQDVQGVNVLAQKLSPAGVPQWNANGLPVCSEYGQRIDIDIATDHAGGAHVVWSDGRYLNQTGYDIYRQHVTAAGTLTIDAYDVFAGSSNDDTRPTLYTDPAGYGIVVFRKIDGNYALRFNETTVSVAISEFNATAREGRVVLNAELRSDLQIHGVRIYRAIDTGGLQLLHSGDAPTRNAFRYEDTTVLPGTRYRYQLVVTDGDGDFSSPIVELTTPKIATALAQNHPNPFNPETSITFALEKDARTTVDIFAIDGRHVRTLLDENRGAGFHRVTWNGTDTNGNPVGSGVYLYRLSADKFSATRKMVLLK